MTEWSNVFVHRLRGGQPPEGLPQRHGYGRETRSSQPIFFLP